MFAKSASCGLHRKKNKSSFLLSVCVWHCLVVARILLCDGQHAGQEGNAPYFDSFLFFAWSSRHH